MRKSYAGLVLSVLILASPLAGAEELRIAASTTAMTNVFVKTDKAFEKATGIKIRYIGDYKTGDAVAHLVALIEGKADASTSGNPSHEVIEIARKDRGINSPLFEKITQRLIGHDLMSVHSHKGTGVTKLSMEQVEALFTGKITNWKQVGGADLPVKLVVQSGKPSTLKTFQKLAMGNANFAAGALDVKDHDDAIALVGKTPGAIGFGPNANSSAATTKIETPIIGRAIFMFTLGKPSDTLQKFMDFIRVEGPRLGVGK